MKFLFKFLSFTFIAVILDVTTVSATDCSEYINEKKDSAIITYFAKAIEESEDYIQDMKYTKITPIFPSIVPTFNIYYKVKFADSENYLNYVVKVISDNKCLTVTPIGEPLPEDFR
ncbi:MAG: hypothetical protein QE271_10050 [Bacteriovoracaceae bacterium]|nr:hypothetical protein [Bacteriovoracaceae bacterium]